MDESGMGIAGCEMSGVVRCWRAEVEMDEDENARCLLMIHDMRLNSFGMAKDGERSRVEGNYSYKHDPRNGSYN